jgi:hypothetical protein
MAVVPGVSFIKAGTLDDTTWLDPKMHIYCDSAERWTLIPESSQKFAKMPTETGSDGGGSGSQA